MLMPPIFLPCWWICKILTYINQSMVQSLVIINQSKEAISNLQIRLELNYLITQHACRPHHIILCKHSYEHYMNNSMWLHVHLWKGGRERGGRKGKEERERVTTCPVVALLILQSTALHCVWYKYVCTLTIVFIIAWAARVSMILDNRVISAMELSWSPVLLSVYCNAFIGYSWASCN